MIDQTTITEIEQIRLDNLAAKYLHQKKIATLNNLNQFVDALALLVPVLYFPMRYEAKDTCWQSGVEKSWEFLAALLLAFTIWRLIRKWQDSAQAASRYMGVNITIASEAARLLRATDSVSPAEVDMFRRLADQSEHDDRQSLASVQDKDKQTAYHEALKEFAPGGDTRCFKCNASPWEYRPGTCQICGNTPGRTTA
jgi:mobilome CxxCx(11)CxxC protein